MDPINSIGGSATRVGSVAKTGAPAAAASDPKKTSQSSASKETKTLSAAQGAAAVDKALTKSNEAFSELRSLQDDIRKATESGKPLDDATKKSLNDRIKAVAAKIDSAAKDKSSDTNLSNGATGSVKIANTRGVDVTVTAQTLDSKSLGLTDADGKVVQITDDASLRKVTGQVAQATGKAQLESHRLQTVQGITGAPSSGSSSGSALGAVASAAKAVGNQIVDSLTGGKATAAATGTEAAAGAKPPGSDALASVQKALDAARSFNDSKTSAYSALGQSVSAPAQKLLSLFA